MFKHPLAREIAAFLALKLVLLIGLYALFFSPPHRQHVTAADMASHLLPAASQERAP